MGTEGNTSTSTSTVSIINLNIGGIKFATTLGTLTKYPKSKLASIFSEKMTSIDEKETYFIDGDGEMFTYILHYMRREQLDLPTDFKEYDRLLTEANFYQIHPLVELIRHRCHTDRIKSHTVLLCILSSVNVVTASHFKSDAKFDVISTGRNYDTYKEFLIQQGYVLFDSRKTIGPNVFKWAGRMHSKGYISNPAITCEGTDVSQFRRLLSPHNGNFDVFEIWEK